jgi:hypothetical protein
MKTVQHINILIIGRTRTGKSTIKSLLVNPTTVPNDLTLKSGTKDPQFQAFHLQDKDSVLNVIDTPGLFERSNNEIDIRDNETILNTIKMCANMEITKFHAICFCVSLVAGINREDIVSIEALIKFLGKKTSKNSCLIITHCESKSEGQRETLRQELVQDAYFKNIAPFFQLGILFSGSINRDDYNYGNESVYDQFFTISDYRMQLIEMFLSVKDPLPITDMKISPTRTAADSKRQTEAELKELQELVAEQEHIIAQFQLKGVYDERQIEQLKENYRNAVLREQQLRSYANNQF